MERGKLKAKYYQQENLILYFNYSVNLNLFKIKKRRGNETIVGVLKGRGEIIVTFCPKIPGIYIFQILFRKILSKL